MIITFKKINKKHYFKEDDYCILEGELIGTFSNEYSQLYVIFSNNKIHKVYQENIIAINGAEVVK